MPDAVIDQLNRKVRRIHFTAATNPLIEGAGLRETGNRSYGKNIYVATHDPYKANDEDLLIGRALSAGTVERLGDLELRCEAKHGALAVAIFDAQGRARSRTLTARVHGATACDEGLFAWFSELEDICTPWNDSDPPVCQVVTVDGLRRYAAARARVELPEESDRAPLPRGEPPSEALIHVRLRALLEGALPKHARRKPSEEHAERLPPALEAPYLAALTEARRLGCERAGLETWAARLAADAKPAFDAIAAAVAAADPRANDDDVARAAAVEALRGPKLQWVEEREQRAARLVCLFRFVTS